MCLLIGDNLFIVYNNGLVNTDCTAYKECIGSSYNLDMDCSNSGSDTGILLYTFPSIPDVGSMFLYSARDRGVGV